MRDQIQVVPPQFILETINLHIQDRTGRWTEVWASFFGARLIEVEYQPGDAHGLTTRVEFKAA